MSFWNRQFNTVLILVQQNNFAPWVLWFSLGTLVSSTNKTDRHDITEMLKVALNTKLYHKITLNIMIFYDCSKYESSHWNLPCSQSTLEQY